MHPHQALGYLTPQQSLAHWQHQRQEVQGHSTPGRVNVIARPAAARYNEPKGRRWLRREQRGPQRQEHQGGAG
ncbi:MAG: hypothetical protein HY686_07755 [Chloroflexi bacterium]|nr:hypothetical protein [Chloroflexota bacterium]